MASQKEKKKKDNSLKDSNLLNRVGMCDTIVHL